MNLRHASVFAIIAAVGCNSGNASPDPGPDASNQPDVGGDVSDAAAGDAFDALSSTVCNTATTWDVGTTLSISTSSNDFFGSITSDELTIAWMTNAGAVLYADRASATDAFGTPQTLTAAVALDHVTLSSDGLTLIMVQDNRYSLTQSTRTARGAAFSTTLDKTPFATLDPAVTEADGSAGPSHGLFADPMLSPDGQFFYYSQYGTSTLTMYETYRATGDTTPWGEGRNLLESQLAAPDTTGTRMRPTGMSVDNLTLFFFDEVAGTERVAFRGGAIVDDTYNQFVSLGAAYVNAAPTASCKRIYFGATDIFSANAK